MKIHLLFLSVIIFIASFTSSAYAQADIADMDDATFEKFEKAMQFVYDDNFKDALPILLELDKKYPDNANLKFNIGICYMNFPQERHLAIPYLEKACENISLDYNEDDYAQTTAPAFAYYFLAKAYHLNYQLDKAISYFTKFKYYLTIDDSELIDDANHQIAMCYNAKKLISTPVNLQSTNLGKDINTEYAEYAPAITSDGKTMIFTSRKKGSTGMKTDYDGQYFEDMYITEFKDNKWTRPANMGSNVNTSNHEASISMSHDGKSLFMYKAEDQYGDIYISRFQNGFWSVPEKLPKEINSKARETHCCISPDEQTLYFVSDRNKGYGGKDIYKSVKTDDGWSKAELLGPQINTQYDEESPFLLSDGKTLFFSSEGHESMGGFDIFYTKLGDDGQWSAPQNIGYPVNTADDDVFYAPIADGSEAFYASEKKGGFGSKDIYHVKIVKDQSVMATYSGRIIDSISGDGVETIVEVVDLSNNKVVASTGTKQDGEFTISLPIGKNYKVFINDINFLPLEKLISIPGNAYNAKIGGVLKLKPAPVSTGKILYSGNEIIVGERVILDNIFFGPGESALSEESHKGITELYFFLYDFPSLKIEVSCHTNSMGEEEENIRLSEARAKAVADYLLQGGVDDNRIEFKGYGSAQPIASNTDEEGRKLNERVEFKVISRYSGASAIYVISSRPKVKNTPMLNIKYSVQISSSQDDKMAEELKSRYGLELDVFVHKYAGAFKYCAGKFDSYKEANDYNKFLQQEKGINSFTIAFKEDERISIHEARIITNED